MHVTFTLTHLEQLTQRSGQDIVDALDAADFDTTKENWDEDSYGEFFTPGGFLAALRVLLPHDQDNFTEVGVAHRDPDVALAVVRAAAALAREGVDVRANERKVRWEVEALDAALTAGGSLPADWDHSVEEPADDRPWYAK